MNLRDAVLTICKQYGYEKTYWIAYSGGLDSHVLLSLCAELNTEQAISFRVVHINHHLSPHSAAWAAHCAQICAEYGMHYIERDLHISLEKGDSLEAIARKKRYEILAKLLSPGDVLLTAHQQDDQAETVLLQLLRGAGPKGLAAMPTVKSFSCGFHARPLLSFSRAELLDYAKKVALKWCEDESNENTQFARNFIRKNISPLLKTRWPMLTHTLARSAAHCAESQLLLEELALIECDKRRGSQENTLSVTKLLSLSLSMQRLMLRTWIMKNNYLLPETKKIDTIQQEVLLAADDRKPCVHWQNATLRRYRDDLYLLPHLPAHNKSKQWTWYLSHAITLPGIGTLQAELTKGNGLRADIQHVSLRFRQGGERISLAGRGRHHLKNLLQEWHIPPWERDRIPLLFIEDQLAAVAGYCVDTHYAASSDQMGYQVVMKRGNDL